MPTINTQPISAAHDKLFASVTNGLAQVQARLVSLSGKVNERTASVPALQKVLTPASIESGFSKLEKSLAKQHDFVEGLLAKTR